MTAARLQVAAMPAGDGVNGQVPCQAGRPKSACGIPPIT